MPEVSSMLAAAAAVINGRQPPGLRLSRELGGRRRNRFKMMCAESKDRISHFFPPIERGCQLIFTRCPQCARRHVAPFHEQPTRGSPTTWRSHEWRRLSMIKVLLMSRSPFSPGKMTKRDLRSRCCCCCCW